MIVSESVIEKINSHQLTNNKTNWELFKQLVEEKIELQVPIKSENEIEKEIDRLLDVIQSSAWESTPKLSSRRENSIG